MGEIASAKSDPEPPLAACARRGRFSPSAFRLPSGVAGETGSFPRIYPYRSGSTPGSGAAPMTQ